MRRRIFSLLLMLISLEAIAQEESIFKYLVRFKDKKNNPYNTEKASPYLSRRALERRAKYHIKVDETDLPLTPSYVEQLGKVEGVEIRNCSRWLNGVSIHVRQADTANLHAVRALPFVESVSCLGVDKLRAVIEAGFNPMEALAMLEKKKGKGKKPEGIIPYTPEFYGEAYTQAHMLRVEDLHKKGFNGSGVLVAMLDAGYRYYHLLPAMDSMRSHMLLSYDVVQKNDTVWDDDDHGLAVLSCLAAYEPGKMVGTGYGATYALLRPEDNTSEYPIEEFNWAVAAEFADSIGADIINSSLGYNTFDDKSMNHTPEQMDGKTCLASIAAGLAAKKGILVCNSAGNEGNDEWKYLGTPADASDIFTVGAVDAGGHYASFSSRGLEKDKRIKPTVAALGEFATVLSPNGVFYKGNGTSYANPVFCGALVCLFQANPAKSPQEIMQAVIMSASHYKKPDKYTGYGIPDMALANKILGGDSAMPLQTDQLLDVSVPFSSNELTYTFYSGSEQELEVEIRDSRKNKQRYHTKLKLKKGECQRIFIPRFKKWKKGSYNFTLKSNIKTYTLVVEKH